MKTSVLPPIAGFLLFVVSATAEKEITSYDTTSPNVFWFSASEYVVDEHATNVLITVQWTPGDRGWSGWVDYYTSNTTATAGQDYDAVSGRLYFSGPAWQTFSVPIRTDCVTEGEESFQLFLVNTNATITQSNAVVRIADGSCVPGLEIQPAAGGIVLRWPVAADGFTLERSDDAATTWSPVISSYSVVNGSNTMAVPTAGPLAMFRLRKSGQ